MVDASGVEVTLIREEVGTIVRDRRYTVGPRIRAIEKGASKGPAWRDAQEIATEVTVFASMRPTTQGDHHDHQGARYEMHSDRWHGLAAIPRRGTRACSRNAGGSYARTCTNVQSYGGQVTAECRRMDGSWDRSTVDVQRCAGGIANTDGRLTCNSGGSGYQPRGGYHNGYGR
jgi:hypothetical protein